MIAKATEPALLRRLQILHMDYIMLMCLVHQNMDQPNMYLPAHEEQFFDLVELLGDGQGVAPTVATGDTQKSAVSGSNVHPVKRTQFENLRVDASKVVPMDQISGYEDAKQEIEAAIFIPTRAPQFVSHGIASGAILLYGPPGTGKTWLAMSEAAFNSKCTTFKVSSSDLMSNWMGESEQNVASMFAVAAENSPAIIILDEVESLCQDRDSNTASEGSSRRVTATFLEKMTQYENVCVIATTNLPWQLDPAFARRFQEKIHVGLPSKSVRLDIVRQRLRPFHHALNDDDMAVFAQYSEGFTGDTIVVVIKRAIRALVMELKSTTHFKKVSFKH